MHRQMGELLLQECSSLLAERIADIIQAPPIFAEGREDPVLHLGPLTHQYHPCPRQLPLVTQLCCWNPYRWQRAAPLQHVHAMVVQPVSLVPIVHAVFGFACVHQQRPKPCSLDLVCNPIPIANSLDGYAPARLTPTQERLKRSVLVRDLTFQQLLTVLCLHRGQRVVLVHIECDILFHGASPPRGCVPIDSTKSLRTYHWARLGRFHTIRMTLGVVHAVILSAAKDLSSSNARPCPLESRVCFFDHQPAQPSRSEEHTSELQSPVH